MCRQRLKNFSCLKSFTAGIRLTLDMSCNTNIEYVLSRINTKKNEYINNGLRRCFRNLGKRIGRNPTNFIIFPILFSFIFITGFRRFKLITDFEIIFISPESEAVTNRQYIEKIFPTNMSNFDPGKVTRQGRYGVAMIFAKDEGSVLRHSIFRELKLLDRKVKQLAVQWDNTQWRYKHICARKKGYCLENVILSISDHLRKYENGKFIFKYPIHQMRGVNESLLALGGVIKNEKNEISFAKSVLLTYYLDNSSESREIRSSLWEEAFTNLAKSSQFENIFIEVATSKLLSKEIEQHYSIVLRYGPVSVILIISFSVLTSLSPDWLRSKPWTGILSTVAAGLAVISGIGLMLHIGEPFAFFCLIAPFLVVGIAMDDSFVMLSAWKQTDPNHLVEERLAETYFESGIAITITSITNIAAFVVGRIYATYMGIKVFCMYMAACLIFDYIYQITFVGAYLALCGYAEKKGRHSLFLFRLTKNSERGKKTLLSKLFCTSYPSDDYRKRGIFSLSMFDEFWKFIGKVLTWSISKVIVTCLYLAYLVVAILNLTKTRTTDSYKDISIYNSSLDRYIDALHSNYYENIERIQFVINKTLNYADPQVQQNIENMMQSFEADEFISGPELTESWLRSYLLLLNQKSMSFLLSRYNITEESIFIEILRDFFLRHPQAERFKSDIVFNENYTQIVVSRFFCQTNITRSATDFHIQANRFKKAISNTSYPIIMFNPKFPVFDGIETLLPIAIKTLCIIVIVLVIISLLFLSSLIGTLCVCYSIFSIGVGIVGYMNIWNITFSLGTVIVLIVASGLSVDCSVHIVCAYISQENTTPNQKLQRAVALVGLPIFQGSFTTVLSMVVFVSLPVIAYVSVVKLFVLVCLLGALHGIVVLPVLVCLIESLVDAIVCKKSSASLETNENGGNIEYKYSSVNTTEQIDMPAPPK